MEPDTQLFTDASNICLGGHWNALSVSGQWTPAEKKLHINVLELEAIQRVILHWLKTLIGLSALVASGNSNVVSYINKQGGTRSILLCIRTKKLHLVCQTNQIRPREIDRSCRHPVTPCPDVIILPYSPNDRKLCMEIACIISGPTVLSIVSEGTA